MASCIGISEMVCRISISFIACKLAASKGLKFSPSNSLRLISPNGLSTLAESLTIAFVAVSVFTSTPFVSGAFVMVCGAGVGVRMEGMRGGGSTVDEDTSFARSAAAAASIRLLFSSSSSLFSLACASAAMDMVLTRACSRTCLSLK